MKFKIIGIHKPKEGIHITELYNVENESHRRFIVRIDGFRPWLLYDDIVQGDTLKNVTKEAKAIQKRIQDGDDEVFCDLSYTDKER